MRADTREGRRSARIRSARAGAACVLKQVKVGDRVDFTWTEAVTIEVSAAKKQGRERRSSLEKRLTALGLKRGRW